MTSTVNANVHRGSLLERLIDEVAVYFDKLRARREAKVTARALRELPPSQLEDIGLTEADIEAAARGEFLR